MPEVSTARRPLEHRRRLRQLHLRTRRRQGAGLLPARHIRPPRRGQRPVRSDQPVPPQPEHPPLRRWV